MKLFIRNTFVIIAVMSLASCLSTGYQASESETQIAEAVIRNDTEQVRALLKAGVSAESRMPGSGAYVLNTALMNNNIEMIQMLIDAGAQVNHTDSYGQPLLHSARKAPAIRLMLEHGADMYATYMGTTAYESFAARTITPEAAKKQAIAQLKAANLPASMYEAAIKQSETSTWLSNQDIIDVYNVYADFKYDVNRQHEEDKHNLVFAAAEAENYELLAALISGKAADLNRRNTGDRSVLAIITESDATNRTAAEYDAIATQMVRNGARVDDLTNMVDDSRTATALMFAAKSGFVNRCKTLLKLGASVKAVNERKQTPLFFATDYKVAKLLIENGGDPLVKDKWQQTLLFYQINKDVIELLLSYGVKINDETVDGNTALFEVRDIPSVKCLIANGANVNHVNKENQSALSYGVMQVINAMRHDRDIQPVLIPKFKILIDSGLKQEYIDAAYEVSMDTGFDIVELREFLLQYVSKK